MKHSKRTFGWLAANGKPRSVPTLAAQHIQALLVRGYAEAALKVRNRSLLRFADWCDARGIDDVTVITRPMLERYQSWLFYYRKRDGKGLTFRSQAHQLSAVKQLFRWLMRDGHILSNPASELELPKCERRLPRVVLTTGEVERVMAQPDVGTLEGLRDRAILEVLYSTGMRRSELQHLAVFDVDMARGVVAVRQGKGKKDRVVPIGERAVEWVERYLEKVRPQFMVTPDAGVLFLTMDGDEIQASTLSKWVHDYLDRARLNKAGSCHVLRHTAATLMLENGADIRFIQAFLGHADLSTTQIYTQVSVTKLKEIHAATHPGARPLNGTAQVKPHGEAAADLQAELDVEDDDDAVATTG